MGFQVVTIAMMTGASAERIGRLAAEQLGFQFVNNEILDRAAEHAGVSRQDRNWFWYHRLFDITATRTVAILRINKALAGGENQRPQRSASGSGP